MAYLGLNTSGFQRGLATATDKAKEASGTIGKEVSKDFVKSLKRTIGAGAIAGAVVGALKDAQEIRNGAESMGVTSQQFAAMEIVAARLGDTTNVTVDEFRRLTDAVIESGQVADNNVFEKLAESADKAEAAMRKFKSAGNTLLSGVVTGTEAVGGFIGGLLQDENSAKGGGFLGTVGRRVKQGARQFSKILEGDSGKTDDIFKNVKRDIDTLGDRAPNTEWESWARSVDNFNKKPRSEKTGSLLFGEDQFARIGLGAGRGVFDIQKQMLDEQKRTNRLLEKGLS